MNIHICHSKTISHIYWNISNIECIQISFILTMHQIYVIFVQTYKNQIFMKFVQTYEV
jgi:hypothetical protein